jgi:hypothetical protein
MRGVWDEGVSEQVAEQNIWTEEGLRDMILEETAFHNFILRQI